VSIAFIELDQLGFNREWFLGPYRSKDQQPSFFGPLQGGLILGFTCVASTIPTKDLASGLAASSIDLVNRALVLISFWLPQLWGAYGFSTYNVFEPVVDPALHALGGLVGEGDGHYVRPDRSLRR
jgi:hypothetical protein